MALGSFIPHLQTPALALALVPDCSINADDFQCKLLSVLHLLYILGAALAVVLTVVILFAIRAWHAGRSNQEIPPPKPKQEPHSD